MTTSSVPIEDPPGPRRSVIEEIRRERIVEATVAVIAEMGYAKASLARIAKRAGISKGLISYHFRDKDDLMEQTLRTTYAAIVSAVIEAVDVTAPAPEILRAAVLYAAEYGQVHRHRFRALDQIVHNLRDADGRSRLTLADYEDRYSQLENLFRRGQAEGTFRTFDTRVMAVTYQSAMDTMFGYADAYPDTDLIAYATSLADLLLAAISSRDGTAASSDQSAAISFSVKPIDVK